MRVLGLLKLNIPHRYRGKCYLNIQPSVVVDVGAYVGYTVQAWKRWWPECEVIAFEPLYFERLVENVKGLEKVTCHDLAVGPWDRNVKLCFEGRQKVVTMRRLDMFKLKPDFLKIDVEGCELGVLTGALETIHLNHPTVQIEVGQTRLLSDAMMQRLGYHPVDEKWPDVIYEV